MSRGYKNKRLLPVTKKLAHPSSHPQNGLYMAFEPNDIDRRTRWYKAKAQFEGAIVDALGGADNVTPMQQGIIAQAGYKMLRCALFQRDYMLNRRAAKTTDKRYLQWANSLRADLQLLGLERKARKIPELRDYLEGEVE
ncbi:MAG: hypothetical protein JXR49_09490 [Acidobacteria bacterium]|nr:hypothetical protein [Acidobacteriota bacterium]